MEQIKEINIIFICNGDEYSIKSQINELIKNIYIKYEETKGLNHEEVCYLYNGNVIDENSTIENMINKDEKQNEMKLLAYDFKEDEYDDLLVQSKEIICPSCKEICEINFSDYKISLGNCKNGHYFKDILLNEFNDFQKIKEKKILCDNCNNNKMEAFKNEFFKCCYCNKNLCPLCKNNHNNKHIIIEYDNKNNLCNQHGKRIILYCKDCKQNLCDLCDLKNHNYVFLYKKAKDNINNLDTLRKTIDKLKIGINNIINDKSNLVISNFEIYY